MRDQTRVYLLLTAANGFLFALAFTLLLVYQVEVAGLTPFQLVVVGTVLEVTCFLGEIPTGVVADVHSRRLSVLLGLTLIGVAIVLQGALATFWWILAAQVVWGLGYTFTSGATEAWIADEVGEREVEGVFLRGQRLALAGSIVGTATAGATGLISPHAPMLIAGPGYLLLVVTLLVVMREPSFHRRDRLPWRGTLRSGLGQVRRRPVVRSFLLISLLAGMSGEAFDRLWTAHVLESFTLPVPSAVLFAGFAIAAQLVALAANAVVSRLRRSPRPGGLLAGLTIVQVAGMIGLAVLGSLWLALGAVLLRDAARTLSGPLESAWLNRHVDAASRATVLSVNSQFDAIGQVVGGPPLGALAGRTTIRFALIACAILLTPVGVLLARLRG